MNNPLIWLLVSHLAQSCSALSISRRKVLDFGVSSILGVGGGVVASSRPRTASAAAETTALDADYVLVGAVLSREGLLRAIAEGQSDEAVLAWCDQLIPFDPSGGKGASVGSLGGSWRLLWTKDEAPAAAQLLRKAFHQPVSTQLLGAEAAALVGEGRVAQLLDVAGLVHFELSSGATPDGDDPSVLNILPPFRFSASFAGGSPINLANADSDADFRAVNARSEEARKAPRNRYTQQYLETSGHSGDIRVSRITEGDPAIVGNVYVHQRL